MQIILWPVSKSVDKGGVGKCAISQHPVSLTLMGHGIKARTHTCQSNRVIHNSSTAGAPETTQLAASWFLGPNSCLVGNYAIPKHVWVHAIIHSAMHTMVPTASHWDTNQTRWRSPQCTRTLHSRTRPIPRSIPLSHNVSCEKYGFAIRTIPCQIFVFKR